VITDSGLGGFLPNSHIGAGEHYTVGNKIHARALEINRKENKIIFSQKRTMSVQTFEEAIKQFQKGGTVEVIVANTAPFGIFVTLPVEGKKTVDGEQLVLDGLIHISEISWEKVEDVTQVYQTGEKIKAKIIGFDKDARRVDFSVKQLTQDPFETILVKYPIDTKVKGTVSKVDDNGVVITIVDASSAAGQIEGVIRKDKIPPTVTFTEGQTVSATVSEVDKRRHKLYLVPVLLEKPLGYR
jgi:small subunit ribosomal protein S1